MKPIAVRVWVVLGALLVLCALNFAIIGKERVRRDGELVYLRLAPVDPRSLIQGDYMALRFAISRDIEGRRNTGNAMAPEGTIAVAPVTLDTQRVARLATADTPMSLTLRYRIRNGRVWLGTNAFFFQEGDSQRFSAARFGEFRVDRNTGEAVLVGLRDENLAAL